MESSGILHVVATPIGNLDDISMRARTVLAAVALIAAEDTRHTRQLLDRFGIATPLLSMHEHNEQQRIGRILAELRDGRSVALVSDAGTPLISDPGYRLVTAVREQGHRVTAIPGCCAAIAALSIAGLPTSRFHFEGFLPSRAGARQARLETLRVCPDTLVFYEAVHRIGQVLADMETSFGAQRPAFVARELTKLHESVHFGTLAEVRAALARDPGADKGEFTLVIGGAPPVVAEVAELARVVSILAAELPAAQAATLAAKLTGASRREAYRLALDGRHRGDGLE